MIEGYTLAISACLVGFIALTFGADRLVTASAALAFHYNVSRLIIGLTIVAFGTSSPEIIVALDAALHGTPNIAIGNAIGSNLANIGLVLGIACLLSPIKIQPHFFKRELPFLFVIMCLVASMFINQVLSQHDAIWLLFMLLIVLMRYAYITRYKKEDIPFKPEEPVEMKTIIAWLFLFLGLGMLILGADMLVRGAVVLAKLLKVDEVVIGLTLVAVGTSLPEVATSIVAAIKKHDDIAIGNVIGSNIFNLLAVLPATTIKGAVAIPPQVITRDWPLMFLFTLLLYLGYKKKCLSRFSGGLLLGLYIAYITILFL